MAVVKTDLRVTRESAKRIRFYPAGIISATNVQDALLQVSPGVVAATPVTFAMSPYAPRTTDSVLLVDTTLGPVTIAMPASASRNNFDLEIKDVAGMARTNPITITFAGGENADGLSPYVIDGTAGDVRLGPRPTGGYFVRS